LRRFCRRFERPGHDGLGRPKRFAAGLGGSVAGDGAIGLTRGGGAILALRNTAARVGEASVRTSLICRAMADTQLLQAVEVA
jgi:hypothetical protein